MNGYIDTIHEVELNIHGRTILGPARLYCEVGSLFSATGEVSSHDGRFSTGVFEDDAFYSKTSMFLSDVRGLFHIMKKEEEGKKNSLPIEIERVDMSNQYMPFRQPTNLREATSILHLPIMKEFRDYDEAFFGLVRVIFDDHGDLSYLIEYSDGDHEEVGWLELCNLHENVKDHVSYLRDWLSDNIVTDSTKISQIKKIAHGMSNVISRDGIIEFVTRIGTTLMSDIAVDSVVEGWLHWICYGDGYHSTAREFTAGKIHAYACEGNVGACSRLIADMFNCLV